MTTYLTEKPWQACFCLAMGGSQLLRMHETFSISYHAVVLLLPPTLVAFYNAQARGTSVDVLALASYYAAYLTSLIVWTILYRVSPLHPLSRYPGPFCLLTLRGYGHYRLKALHEQYGDVVRIGPNEISIRDPEMIGPLLGASGVPKGPGIVGSILASGHRAEDTAMIGLVDVALSLDVDEHLHRRRPWNRAFGSTAVKEYEPLIARRTRQLLVKLSQQKGVVSLGKWLNHFSYDFMCDMAYGGGSELLRDGDENNVWALLDHGVVLGAFFCHLPWLGPYVGSIPGAAGPLSTLMAHARRFAMARIQRGSSTRDLFHYLNNEDLPDKPPPPTKQLVDDSILAIIAGADTTSSAILSVVFCLATNPQAYAELQAEVDKFFPAGEDFLSAHDAKEMPYLSAVINEALRLYPPAPGGGHPRKVPPGASPLAVGSLILPPGTSFWIHVYSMHRDPRNFAHPDAFWPDRWLVTSGRTPLAAPAPPPSALSPPLAAATASFTHNESAFLPFSHGPMNCAGKNLALLELRMVVCALLQRFRIRLAEGWDVREYEKGYKDHFVAARPEFPVVLEAR
ncbi:high nitrogen upregulated cytochrome P450 monooxygenase 2 [Cerioporus squamosus]|nr:high nitrogen upregulated cytochrome P450 monooxygenase 2 [Cerioporus squamosus]